MTAAAEITAVADAVWPATLPPPRTASLRERLPDLTVRSRMAVGPDKVRRRASVGIRQFDVELDLTGTTFQALHDFYIDTLEGGALTFEWDDPRTGTTPTEFRFLKPPSGFPRMPRKSDGSEPWRASFAIEVIPAAADEVTGGGGETLTDLFQTMQVGEEVEHNALPAVLPPMFIPFEAPAAAPEFLLESIQVMTPEGEGGEGFTSTQFIPVGGGGNNHGPPDSTGAIVRE